MVGIQGHQRTSRHHRNGHHQPLHFGGPKQAPRRGPPAGAHAVRLGQTSAANTGGDQPAEETPRTLRRGAGGRRQEDLCPSSHFVRLQPLFQVPTQRLLKTRGEGVIQNFCNQQIFSLFGSEAVVIVTPSGVTTSHLTLSCLSVDLTQLLF